MTRGIKKSSRHQSQQYLWQTNHSRTRKTICKNEESRKGYEKAVKDKIDRVLADPGITTKGELIKALSQQQVYALLRTNEQGRLYGATFVDNEHKVVFNGSNLGKAYSANALNERFKEKETLKQPAPTRSPTQRHSLSKGSKQTIRLDKDWQAQIKLPKSPSLFKPLLETPQVQQGQFKPQRKKRRRKRYHL